ncbi:MAG: potassium-transporting ATPase subunit A [Fimbriimonadaceae bacterium]|nr:potassium-transporting ATPase subunit A [Fimbriimonadaceae bacterium]
MSMVVPGAVLILAVGLSWPLGWYLRWALDPPPGCAWRERWEQRLAPGDEETWPRYGLALLVFNAVMLGAVVVLLACQQWLPLNPDGKGPLTASLVFHTAVSFVTNTNLQHYSGEVMLSYLSQLALQWLQFVSAATGLAALTAIARALAGRQTVGCFRRDLLRATVLVLLPLALLLAAPLAWQGVPMTWQGAVEARTLEGVTQTIARGPVAAFVAIKQLGPNGGGFFGPNSCHPFENPTWLSNVLSCLAIVLLAMASTWMFGRITGRPRHATALFAVMLAFMLAKVGVATATEAPPTRALAGLNATVGPNLEGKELRFGAAAGPTWAAVTTATSNGSVNCMHDSLNPLTGLVPLTGMWLNMVFGGVGVGMINLVVYIVTAAFLAGMMVGRTPEYLGRKVETREMQLAIGVLLLHPALILLPAALFCATPLGRATVANPGSHGLTEIVYEFTSAAANNGSGFEGLGDNTLPWNVATGLVMLLARYLPILLPLAMAGSLGQKRLVAETAGTFRTDTLTFGLLLAATILIIGALLFLPVAVLGPVAEHLAR